MIRAGRYRLLLSGRLEFVRYMEKRKRSPCKTDCYGRLLYKGFFVSAISSVIVFFCIILSYVILLYLFALVKYK